jgi:TetR/AcrR family transcriptional regulator, regulator of cefoperazone and chloramphenicol sensitivity
MAQDASSISTAAETLIPSTTEQVDRRMSLLQAAFDVIAEAGFEGLRTRAVAQRAGVNIATLHYYFPTKNDLIHGLAEFLSGTFATLHAPAPPTTGRWALDHLRQEFVDMRFYREKHPQLRTVVEELMLRAKRDPAVELAMGTMMRSWRSWVEMIVRTGLEEGTFRPELPAEETISMLMAIMAGAPVVGLDAIEGVRQRVEEWLLAPEVKDELRGAGR